MDNAMLAREMLRDFRARWTVRQRASNCPFVNNTGEDSWGNFHELCATLFPGWARKNLKNGHFNGKCPCLTMSHSYVRRKARRFVKEGK